MNSNVRDLVTLSALRNSLTICCVALLVQGCGFALRSESLLADVETIRITGSFDNASFRALERELHLLNVGASTSGEGTLVVKFLEAKEEVRPLRTNAIGEVSESRLTLEWRIALQTESDLDVAEEFVLTAEEHLLVDANKILAVENQKKALFQNLRAKLARELIPVLHAEHLKAK